MMILLLRKGIEIVNDKVMLMDVYVIDVEGEMDNYVMGSGMVLIVFV
jgi:hypothetical protein